MKAIVGGEFPVVIPLAQLVPALLRHDLLRQRVASFDEVADSDAIALGQVQVGPAQAALGQGREPFVIVEKRRQVGALAHQSLGVRAVKKALEVPLGIVPFERRRQLVDHLGFVVAIPQAPERVGSAPPVVPAVGERSVVGDGFVIRHAGSPWLRPSIGAAARKILKTR